MRASRICFATLQTFFSWAFLLSFLWGALSLPKENMFEPHGKVSCCVRLFHLTPQSSPILETKRKKGHKIMIFDAYLHEREWVKCQQIWMCVHNTKCLKSNFSSFLLAVLTAPPLMIFNEMSIILSRHFSRRTFGIPSRCCCFLSVALVRFSSSFSLFCFFGAVFCYIFFLHRSTDDVRIVYQLLLLSSIIHFGW